MVLLSISSAHFAGISMADFIFEPEDIKFGTFYWFVYSGISCILVLFAGIMSGLTLGLMSLGLVELEILQRSGSSTEKKQAAAILPVVQKQHQLLVTLLLCNACAMEALPIYLDKIFHPFVAVVLSVTFVLAFGEVIPQAICTRYGLAVGANFVWLVHILMIICYPIAYPIGKYSYKPSSTTNIIEGKAALISCKECPWKVEQTTLNEIWKILKKRKLKHHKPPIINVYRHKSKAEFFDFQKNFNSVTDGINT